MKKLILPVVLGLCVVAFAVVKWQGLRTPLAERLVSVDDNIRNQALAELPKLNEPKRNATAAAILAIPPQQDPRSRRFALYALRKLGSRNEASIAAYARALGDAEPTVREEATTALMECGESAHPTVFRILESPNPVERAQAIKIAHKIGEPAVPGLTNALQSKDAEVRVDVALALCQIQPMSEAAVPVLSAGLRDRKWDAQSVQMARALEKMGPAAKTAAPELTTLLLKSNDSYSDPDAPRPVLAQVLEQIDPRRRELVDLGFDLKQKNDAVRYRAAYHLSQLQPVNVGAVSMLVDALADKDILVAARSLVALTKIGLDKTERVKKVANPRMKSVFKRGQAAKLDGFVETVEQPLKSRKII